MKRVFIKDKTKFIKRNKAHKIEMFSEELIKDLPEPLKKIPSRLWIYKHTCSSKC